MLPYHAGPLQLIEYLRGHRLEAMPVQGGVTLPLYGGIASSLGRAAMPEACEACGPDEVGHLDTFPIVRLIHDSRRSPKGPGAPHDSPCL